jgi:hypothetical protein
MDDVNDTLLPTRNRELHVGASMFTCRFTDPGMVLEMVGAFTLKWKPTA